MSSQQLEVVVGHLTHACVLNRPSLSVFRAVYDLIRKRYFAKCRLWPSVIREIQIVYGLLPLIVADWALSMSDRITCSDACESGYAVHQAVVGPELKDCVSLAMRWSERWESLNL